MNSFSRLVGLAAVALLPNLAFGQSGVIVDPGPIATGVGQGEWPSTWVEPTPAAKQSAWHTLSSDLLSCVVQGSTAPTAAWTPYCLLATAEVVENNSSTPYSSWQESDDAPSRVLSGLCAAVVFQPEGAKCRRGLFITRANWCAAEDKLALMSLPTPPTCASFWSAFSGLSDENKCCVIKLLAIAANEGSHLDDCGPLDLSRQLDKAFRDNKAAPATNPPESVRTSLLAAMSGSGVIPGTVNGAQARFREWGSLIVGAHKALEETKSFLADLGVLYLMRDHLTPACKSEVTQKVNKWLDGLQNPSQGVPSALSQFDTHFGTIETFRSGVSTTDPKGVALIASLNQFESETKALLDELKSKARLLNRIRNRLCP